MTVFVAQCRGCGNNVAACIDDGYVKDWVSRGLVVSKVDAPVTTARCRCESYRAGDFRACPAGVRSRPLGGAQAAEAEGPGAREQRVPEGGLGSMSRLLTAIGTLLIALLALSPVALCLWGGE